MVYIHFDLSHCMLQVLKTVQSILCALQESYPGLFVVPYQSQYQRQAFVQNLLDTEQAHVCSLGMVVVCCLAAHVYIHH